MLRQTLLFSAIYAISTSAVSAQNFNATPPNAPHQQPAFSDQTRAPIINDQIALNREVIADGLENPWGMDQLPSGDWLVTERPGRMRLVSSDGSVSDPIAGLPQVYAERQGGLLDVIVGDGFANDRRVWWSFAEPLDNGESRTAVATGQLSADATEMTNVEVIFRQNPSWRSGAHFGSRLVFDEAGALFVTTGDRSRPDVRQLAQDSTTDIGKVLRIDPLTGASEVWSSGHRNIQAAALDPDGDLWTVEHGPRGGDELNQPEEGLNYGWPVITYGEDYSGQPIGAGRTQQDGLEQPVYYWDPVIAPSGMVFYEGDLFTDWQGSALIGGLAAQSLVRLEFSDDRVTGEARHLAGEGRVRDVDVALDGSITLLIDAADGELVRLTPADG